MKGIERDIQTYVSLEKLKKLVDKK